MDIERRARPLEFLGSPGKQSLPIKSTRIIAQQL